MTHDLIIRNHKGKLIVKKSGTLAELKEVVEIWQKDFDGDTAVIYRGDEVVWEHGIKKPKKCIYCKSPNYYNQCRDKYAGFECTRKIGHKGQHVGCGNPDHDLKRWENKERRKK